MCCLIHYFDVHEGAGAWLGALASFFVAVVAIGVVFIQDFLAQNHDRRDKAACYAALTANAAYALDMLLEWQTDLYERVRTQGGALGRDWRFELDYWSEVMRVALAKQIDDPAIVQELAKVRSWLQLTDALLALDAENALRRFQGGTNAREASKQSLDAMTQELAQSADRFWPPKQYRLVPKPIRRSRGL